MTNRELKKLSRSQLLEMLLAQSREVTRLRSELEQAQQQLNSQRILLHESGNIAEAALRLNGVFEAAQAAADQYLRNIAEMEAETRARCRKREEKDSQSGDLSSEAEAYGRRRDGEKLAEDESWQEILRMLEEV